MSERLGAHPALLSRPASHLLSRPASHRHYPPLPQQLASPPAMRGGLPGMLPRGAHAGPGPGAGRTVGRGGGVEGGVAGPDGLMLLGAAGDVLGDGGGYGGPGIADDVCGDAEVVKAGPGFAGGFGRWSPASALWN